VALKKETQRYLCKNNAIREVANETQDEINDHHVAELHQEASPG
jgi:hypothetical protein